MKTLNKEQIAVLNDIRKVVAAQYRGEYLAKDWSKECIPTIEIVRTFDHSVRQLRELADAGYLYMTSEYDTDGEVRLV